MRTWRTLPDQSARRRWSATNKGRGRLPRPWYAGFVATYAIGDIQGCFEPLQRLLSRIGFSRRDRVWLVGDLVNRGPQSLEVLRWARGLGTRAVTVLGNHELHLWARALGVGRAKRFDSLEEVLAAPDCGALVGWLATLPLMHRERGFVLVHAGVPPRWTVAEAEQRARACERVLRGPSAPELLRSVERGGGAGRFGRLADDIAAFTRLRTCTRGGKRCEGFSGPPEQAPSGCLPWFAFPDRRSRRTKIVFGHWASLGLHLDDGVLGLDSGCVWGGALTAVRLEDGAVFQVSNRRTAE